MFFVLIVFFICDLFDFGGLSGVLVAVSVFVACADTCYILLSC